MVNKIVKGFQLYLRNVNINLKEIFLDPLSCQTCKNQAVFEEFLDTVGRGWEERPEN